MFSALDRFPGICVIRGDVEVVSCEEAHDNEVYDEFPVPGYEAWPGEEELIAGPPNAVLMALSPSLESHS